MGSRSSGGRCRSSKVGEIFSWIDVGGTDCFGAGKDAIVRKIKENDVTVLIGETGSGKTTRAYPAFDLHNSHTHTAQRSHSTCMRQVCAATA